MFTNLMASAPRRSAPSPLSWSVSASTHALALLAVFWITGRTVDVVREPDGIQVTYLSLPKEPPPVDEPVQPPPPPRVEEPAPMAEVTRPELPAGFQELAAPREILAAIPPPGLVEIRAKDFSGLGIAGGVAGGRPPIPSDTAQTVSRVAPPPVSVALVDKPPRVLNLNDIRPRMQELYPPTYRMADIEGQAVVQLVIDTDGRVEEEAMTIVSASHPEFGAPTREVARLLRWEPAKRNGHPVRVWVRLPVMWTIN